MSTDLGQRVKVYRVKSNLSLRDLAMVPGFSASMLCRIDSGIEQSVKLPEMKALDERLRAIETRLSALEKGSHDRTKET